MARTSLAPRVLLASLIVGAPLVGRNVAAGPTPVPTATTTITPVPHATTTVTSPVGTLVPGTTPTLDIAPPLEWDFEPGSTVRFAGGTSAPACDVIGPESLPHGDELRNAIGGSYWQQTYDDGRKNRCVLNVRQSSEPTLSPEFTIGKMNPFVTFLVGGIEAGARIDIQQSVPELNPNVVRPAGGTIPGVTPAPSGPATRTGWVTRHTYTGTGAGMRGMHRVTVDLTPFLSKWAFRLNVTVPAGGALHIDDVRVTGTREPETSPPVWGLADLHTHPFNHIGTGGKMFSGLIHSSIGYQGLVAGGAGRTSDPAVALKRCHEEHGRAPDGNGVMQMFMEGGHNGGGHPSFEGWPHYYTTNHQQMYVDWLKRAWQGGVRLIHADVGNAAILGALFAVHPGFGAARNPLDDAWNITTELRAMHDFAQLPDVRDWLEIARSPAEARRIIGDGKMAMVLGIEVDDLGNLTKDLKGVPDEGARRRRIRDYLNMLYANDVRHIIPVHVMENTFGAPAVYEMMFAVENVIFNGRVFPMRDAFDSGIRLGSTYDAKNNKLMEAIFQKAGGRPAILTNRGLAHADGLYPNGTLLIQKMMQLGMVVDVDHMSDRSVDMTLGLAQRWQVPVVSSHTGFRELAFGNWVSSGGSWTPNTTRNVSDPNWKALFGTGRTESLAKERDRSAAHLAIIRSLGGMVGVGTGQGALPRAWPFGSSSVTQVCDGSTTYFAQEYLYAIDKMGGRGVALGTDANGFNGMTNPRFGPSACAFAKDDDERKRTQATMVANQSSPVAYLPVSGSRRFLSINRARFDQAGDQGGYDGFERQVYHALVLWKDGGVTGADPGSSANPDTYDQDWRNLVWGLWAGSDNGRGGTNAPRPTQGFPDTAMHKRLGWDLAACPPPITDARKCAATITDSDNDLNRYKPKALRVLADVSRMMRGSSTPMKKSVTGQADFDINIDGYAHYGLTPDFIQDVQNIGVRTQELKPLFRSAEDYIRMWEKIELQKRSVPDL